MQDDIFLAGALDLLPPQVVLAAQSLAAIEESLERFVTVNECRAMADAHGAPHPPVLALFGYLHTIRSKPRRPVYHNIRSPSVGREETVWPTDMDSMMALAICRTIYDQAREQYEPLH